MRSIIIAFLLILTNVVYSQTFKVGDKVDMFSTDSKYYAASIIEKSGERYKIHYDAYDAANDTWVLATNLVRGGRPGDRIIVVATQGTYYGTIQDVQSTSYKVKYDGYPETYTITRSQFNFISSNNTVSSVTPPSQNTQMPSTHETTITSGFSIGASLQALQGTTWYAATIKDIKEGKYLVKYDNYNEEEWVPKERLRAKPTLVADKLKTITGKTYIRSIRWIATGYTEINWYFLGDNGVIVVDPIGGLNPINFALEQAENLKNIGYYTIANNQINIKWLNGKSTSLRLTYKNGEIIEMDAGGIMVRQMGLPDGYKLSGTYSGSMSYGNVSSSGNYTFTKDGGITRTRTGTVNTTDVSARANNTKSGSYTIKGNTLFVNYNDGTREKANIGIFSGAPGKLVLNGSWMTAQ